MRVMFLECTEAELKANRTIGDAMTDMIRSLTHSYASVPPSALFAPDQDEDEEAEEAD